MKKYLAFISYRHCEYDKTVATGLHRSLELLHMPKSGSYPKKRRMFRDEEELPTSSNLGSDINAALEDSEYLIVICSPRLPESKWCLKEIQYYLDRGLSARILPVLIEGDELTSVPECIRDLPVAVDMRTNASGGANVSKGTNASEGANSNHPGRKNLNKQIRTAAIRLLSQMTGVSIDEIEKSEAVSRIVKSAAVMAGIAAVLLGFSLYSGYMAERIAANNAEIQNAAIVSEKARQNAEDKRNEAILSRAKTVADESLEMITAGDYDGAIENILQVLPSEENPDYPISVEAMAVLRTAMAIAQPEYEYVRTFDFDTEEGREVFDEIEKLKEEAEYVPSKDTLARLGLNLNDFKVFSEQNRFQAYIRNDGTLEIYSESTGKRVARSEKKYKTPYFPNTSEELYAITEDGNIDLLNSKTLEPIRSLDCHGKAKQIFASTVKNYLLITCRNSIEIFRHDNGKHMASFPLKEEPELAIFTDYNNFISVVGGERFYVVYRDHADLYSTIQTVNPEISDYIPFIDESYRQGLEWSAFAPDGSACYIQAGGGTLFKWDLKSGKLLWKVFPDEPFSQESGFDTALSSDGKAIWFPQSNEPLQKIDAETGEILFSKQVKVDAQFYDSEGSDIAVLQGKYYTSNIIEGINSTTGEELWILGPDPKIDYSNLKQAGDNLYLIEIEKDEDGIARRYNHMILDVKTGNVKEKKTIIERPDAVKRSWLYELGENAVIGMEYEGDQAGSGDSEHIMIDMASGDILQHYESQDTVSNLYKGYHCLYRTKTEYNEITGEEKHYYATTDENGVFGEFREYDFSEFIREKIDEDEIFSFKDRRAFIRDSVIKDFDTGEPLLYLDKFSAQKTGDPDRILLSSNGNSCGVFYLSDDKTLIEKAHRRVEAIHD